ncbi:hypothetical protein ZHAS_00018483 [Anopheles sinensis]|uniref:Uncharacterized protein n=1 Tax=Anopheles sinensis TaxID=74873 RepID=A0A084WJQ8_ANOSI|nr:hypothetical protein ZHAS_00018483 [Anopheles sinensis]
MVELSSSSDPFQHGFPNVVFIVPAIIVVGLGGPGVHTPPIHSPHGAYQRQLPFTVRSINTSTCCKTSWNEMGDVAEEIFNSLGSEGGAASEGAGAAAGTGEVPMMNGDFKMPTMEEFLSMLDGMDNLSDEEKEELRAGILQNSLRGRLQAGLSDYLVFFVMLSIMLSVFGKKHAWV